MQKSKSFQRVRVLFLATVLLLYWWFISASMHIATAVVSVFPPPNKEGTASWEGKLKVTAVKSFQLITALKKKKKLQ